MTSTHRKTARGPRSTAMTLARLDELFDAEPDRLSRLSLEVGGIYFDWSKTHLDAGTDREVRATGRGAGLCRQARRVVLRRDRQRQRGPPRDPCRRARAGRAGGCQDRRRAAPADAVAGRCDRGRGVRRGRTGCCTSASADRRWGRNCCSTRWAATSAITGSASCSNIDGQAVDDATDPLDPESTLVVAVSKTFTTAETLMNVRAAIAWMQEAGVEDPLRPGDRGHRQPAGGDRLRDRRDPHPAVRRGGRRALFDVVVGRLFGRAGTGLGARSRNCSRARATMDRHFRLAEPAPMRRCSPRSRT